MKPMKYLFNIPLTLRSHIRPRRFVPILFATWLTHFNFSEKKKQNWISITLTLIYSCVWIAIIIISEQHISYNIVDNRSSIKIQNCLRLHFLKYKQYFSIFSRNVLSFKKPKNARQNETKKKNNNNVKNYSNKLFIYNKIYTHKLSFNQDRRALLSYQMYFFPVFTGPFFFVSHFAVSSACFIFYEYKFFGILSTYFAWSSKLYIHSDWIVTQ